MRNVFKLVAVLLALLSVSFVAAAKCDAKLSDGSYYDFSKLASKTEKAVLNSGTFTFMILFRFCGVTDDVTACSPSSAFCLTNEDGSKAVKALGGWTSGREPDSITPIEDGVSIAYNNPTDGLTMLLKCGTADTPTAQRVDNGFVLKFTHPAGCKGSSSGGGGGLSGGWIFIIILLVSVFLYVVIGCVVCMKKFDKRGLDACPHKAFWFSIPGLAKDGCLFTIAKLKGCCGSKGSSERLSDDGADYGSSGI